MSMHFSMESLRAHGEDQCAKVNGLLHRAIASAKKGELDHAEQFLVEAQKLATEVPTQLAQQIEITKKKITSFKKSDGLSDAIVVTPGLSDDPSAIKPCQCNGILNGFSIKCILAGVAAGIIWSNYIKR